MALRPDLISQWLGNYSGVDSIGGHNMSSVSASGYSADAHLGSGAIIYNQVGDKSIVPHHADFSFGNGVTDTPFSFFAGVKMTDATKFRILSKGIFPNAPFLFTTDASDKLALYLYDGVSTNRIIRNSTATLTSIQGSYHLLGCTYDGSGSVSGIKLYIDNTRITTGTATAGTYVAMETNTDPLYHGRLENVDTAGGLIDTQWIWGRDISDGGVAEGNTIGVGSDIDLLWNGGAWVEISPSGILTPYHYNLMRGDTL